jgi:PPM family protein phosphatase
MGEHSNLNSWSVATATERGLNGQQTLDIVYVSNDSRLFFIVGSLGKEGTEGNRIAADVIEALWTDAMPHLFSDDQSIRDWLKRSIEKANRALFEFYATSKQNGRGRGNTIVAAVQSDNNTAHIAHVGDLRAYAFRQGAARALTEDHKLFHLMAKEKPAVIEDLARGRISCGRNLWLRALGHADEVSIDLADVNLSGGDYLVLCNNGLCRALSCSDDPVQSLLENADDAIGEVLSLCKSAAEACEKLVAKALEASDLDNLSIIAVHFDQDGPGETHD